LSFFQQFLQTPPNGTGKMMMLMLMLMLMLLMLLMLLLLMMMMMMMMMMMIGLFQLTANAPENRPGLKRKLTSISIPTIHVQVLKC